MIPKMLKFLSDRSSILVGCQCQFRLAHGGEHGDVEQFVEELQAAVSGESSGMEPEVQVVEDVRWRKEKKLLTIIHRY